MKKKYEKPTCKVYELQQRTTLLTVSGPDPNNPFNWGDPDNDR